MVINWCQFCAPIPHGRWSLEALQFNCYNFQLSVFLSPGSFLFAFQLSISSKFNALCQRLQSRPTLQGQRWLQRTRVKGASRHWMLCVHPKCYNAIARLAQWQKLKICMWDVGLRVVSTTFVLVVGTLVYITVAEPNTIRILLAEFGEGSYYSYRVLALSALSETFTCPSCVTCQS